MILTSSRFVSINRRIKCLKTTSITLTSYDSLVEKTNLRNTAVFQSCFSFSLLPPFLCPKYYTQTRVHVAYNHCYQNNS